MKITLKLVLLFCVCIGFVYAVFSIYVTYSSTQIMKENARQYADILVDLIASRINNQQQSVKKLIDGTSVYFRENKDIGGSYSHVLAGIVGSKDVDIVGSTFAFNASINKKSPYCWTINDTIHHTNLAEKYSYWQKEWYTEVMDSITEYWSEPYEDFKILMITYSKQVRDGYGRLKGVLTADISLDYLSSFMEEIGQGNSFVFLISNRNQHIISSSKKGIIAPKDIDKTYSHVIKSTWNKAAEQLNSSKSIKIDFHDDNRNKNYYITYSPLSAGNWTVGVLFEEDIVLSKVKNVMHKSQAALLLGFLLILTTIVLLAQSITTPLRNLTLTAKKIGKGNLNEPISYNKKGKDEIAILGNALSEMQTNLKQHINLLEEATAQKQKIESELRIAHNVQQSMLPSADNLGKSSFDIYAMLKPAKEVGGDLYDFFMVDSQHLCLIIGDVSDKGVPAALLMATTDTYIRAFSKKNLSPGSILSQTNQQLCENNELCMFVSLFCCIINIKTGECCYSNAGHNLPYIISTNNEVLKFETQNQPVLGVIPNVIYHEACIKFNPSEFFVLYTDGITEAMDVDNNVFGEDRLYNSLIASVKQNSKSIGQEIMTRIEAFISNAVPSDDSTLLIFRLTSNP